MRKAEVIQIHPKSSPSCSLKSSCPVYLNNIEEDIEAAIYTIITASGEIVNGAYKVKPRHLNELLRALDLLSIRLHSALAAA